MVKKVFFLVFMSLFIFSLENISSQNLSIFGEVRPRAEYRDGYGAPITTNKRGGFFIQQRTRFGATFSNSIVKMMVTLQDSRVWGEATHNGDNPSIGLYEGWGEMIILPGLTTRIGRQALKYDNRKLFSPANWSNTGNSHDIMMLKYNKDNDFMIDAGFAYSNNSVISQEKYYEPAMKYRYMELLWASKKLSEDITMSVIGVAISNQDTISCFGKSNYSKHKHYNQFTMGGTFDYHPHSFPLKIFLEGYYQCGKTVYKGSLDKLKSVYLVANASYQIISPLSIAAGYEYISGDKNPNNGTQRGFIHLFRGHHDFTGSMDYWNSTGNRGVQDIYGGLLYKFNKNKSSIEGTYHCFATAVQCSDLKGKKLGGELDFTLKHRVNTWMTLEGGYSTYFVNENVRIIKGVGGKDTRNAQWAYLSMSIKPSIVLASLK